MHGCNPEFNCVHSYAEANEFLKNAKPYPETDTSDPHDKYRLEATRKRHMNIRLMDRQDVMDVYNELYKTDDEARMKAKCEDFRLRHIAFQLYNTDVVIWREDETIILDPYKSKSTNDFVGRCLPHDLHVHYTPRYCLVGAGGVHEFTGYAEDKTYRINTMYGDTEPAKIYRIRDGSGHRAAFRRDAAQNGEWRALAGCGIKPWQVPCVDGIAARAALRAVGFEDFKLWALGRIMMNPRKYNDRSYSMNAGTKWAARRWTQELYSMLADRDQWETLAKLRQFWPILNYEGRSGFAELNRQRIARALKRDPLYPAKQHLRNLIDAMRLVVYETSGVASLVERDYLIGHGAISAYAAKRERYDWLSGD